MSDDLTMSEDGKCNVYVGSQSGFCKGILLTAEDKTMINIGHDMIGQKNTQITALSWNQYDRNEILIGFQNHRIYSFNTVKNTMSWLNPEDVGDTPIVSVFNMSQCIISGDKSGKISIQKNDHTTVFNSYASDHTEKHIKKPTLSCVKPNLLNGSQFASGGCENDLAIWDINKTPVPIFRAKNVRHDWLRLRVPIWISALTYLPNSNLVAISSRHSHVRLYDPRAQHRPVINFQYLEDPLTAIAAIPTEERKIVVGTSVGRMAIFDLRRTCSQPLNTMKTFLGAIKGIEVTKERSPLIFSVALDRYLRVHSTDGGKLLYKHFLKSRPNCLLIHRNLSRKDILPKVKPRKSRSGFRIRLLKPLPKEE